MEQTPDHQLLQKILRNQEQMHAEMKDVKKDTHTIKRAIYGDPDNLVSGLIHRQVDQESRTKRLEDVKKKFLWAAGGVFLALEVIHKLFF